MPAIPYSGQPDNGIFLIHKPPGWTSFDVVKVLRGCLSRLLNKPVKVGHAGTLDPLAEGLMVLATGPQTRRLASLTAQDKAYEALLCLGESTASHDRETPVECRQPVPDLTWEELDTTLTAFRGEILQVPPLYSAIKVKGKRAYERARSGENVNLEPRPVLIHSLNIRRWEPPFLALDIHCSKGTYIRSLARDIGNALGRGAVLEHLLRTRSGDFTLNEAVSIEDIKTFCRKQEENDIP